MRCIEICLSNLRRVRDLINRNMRCIEINRYRTILTGRSKINRNMRCIEIQFPDAAFQAALD